MALTAGSICRSLFLIVSSSAILHNVDASERKFNPKLVNIVEFSSFEEALQVCMQAVDGSEEQKKAMVFCLEHAPVDLRAMLEERLKITAAHQHGINCGCGDHD